MKRQDKIVFAMLSCATIAAASVLSCSSSNSGNNGGEAGGGESGGAGGDGGNAQDGGKGGTSAAGGTAGSSGGVAGKAAGGSGGVATQGGSGGSISANNTATCVPPKLKLTQVAKATDSPMAIAQAPGDDRIFVAERAGLIRILRNGKLETTPFADFTDSVRVEGNDNTSERGLLNLVLHPNFTANGRFYVYYTRKASDPLSTGAAGDIVIAEGKRSANADKAETTLKVFTTVTHFEDNHIGGMLAFGPDGMLYAGTGDGGGPNGFDPFGAGQDKTQKLSKILRFDVDKPGEKPAGNLAGDTSEKFAWAYGVRNPFRGTFDRATGDLYFGDVGESSYEEVNFVPPGQRDINFGWGFDSKVVVGNDLAQSGMEGLHPFPFFTAVAWAPRDYLPIFEYPHDGPGWSASPTSYMKMGFACGGGGSCAAAVVGGFVYRGKKMPGMYGRYIFGDNPRNKVNSFIVADKKATCQVDLTADLVTAQTPIQDLSGFGQDADGELYVLDLIGHIYKIEAE